MAAAKTPIMPMHAVAEITRDGFLDDEINQSAPPESSASFQVAALSIHISGVWTMNSRVHAETKRTLQ